MAGNHRRNEGHGSVHPAALVFTCPTSLCLNLVLVDLHLSILMVPFWWSHFAWSRKNCRFLVCKSRDGSRKHKTQTPSHLFIGYLGVSCKFPQKPPSDLLLLPVSCAIPDVLGSYWIQLVDLGNLGTWDNFPSKASGSLHLLWRKPGWIAEWNPLAQPSSRASDGRPAGSGRFGLGSKMGCQWSHTSRHFLYFSFVKKCENVGPPAFG